MSVVLGLVPAAQFVDALEGVAITRPAGKVSVKPIDSLEPPALLSIEYLRVVVSPEAIIEG